MIVSKSAMVPIKSPYDTRPFNLNENRIELPRAMPTRVSVKLRSVDYTALYSSSTNPMYTWVNLSIAPRSGYSAPCTESCRTTLAMPLSGPHIAPICACLKSHWPFGMLIQTYNIV